MFGRSTTSTSATSTVVLGLPFFCSIELSKGGRFGLRHDRERV